MRLVVKHTQIGYVSPADRPGCRNCKKLTDATPENGIGLPPRPYCAMHSVEVTTGAICNSYSPGTSPGRGLADISRQRDLLQQLLHPLPKSGRLQ